ncbi:MAG: hypothetical protein ABI898_02855 [Sphingomonadales bacterium]
MDFMKIFDSLDELLYEVMSWAVFYPVTLWRTVTQPLAMMNYADTELGDAPDEQYSDTLSPPLFLLLTLFIVHGIELSLVGDSPLVSSRKGLSALITDDTNLLFLRMIIFAVFPLVFAVSLVRQTKAGLDRRTLRLPFYAQSYVAAPYALATSGAAILVRLPSVELVLAGLVIIAAGVVWFLSVQTVWFAKQLQCSKPRGFFHALAGYAAALLILGLIGSLFV